MAGGLCPECGTIRGPWDDKCGKCGFSFAALDAERKKEAALAAAAGAPCPSCGIPRQAGQAQCASCHVDFAKWEAAKARREDEERQRLARGENVPQSGSPDDNKERPGCLTLMMGATILVNAAVAFFILMLPVPQKALPIASSLLMIVLAVGVLKWQRWAVYALATMQILGIIGAYLIGMHPFLYVHNIAMVVLLIYLYRSVWYQFR